MCRAISSTDASENAWPILNCVPDKQKLQWVVAIIGAVVCVGMIAAGLAPLGDNLGWWQWDLFKLGMIESGVLAGVGGLGLIALVAWKTIGIVVSKHETSGPNLTPVFYGKIPDGLMEDLKQCGISSVKHDQIADYDYTQIPPCFYFYMEHGLRVDDATVRSIAREKWNGLEQNCAFIFLVNPPKAKFDYRLRENTDFKTVRFHLIWECHNGRLTNPQECAEELRAAIEIYKEENLDKVGEEGS